MAQQPDSGAGLRKYYAERAREYEKIYEKPERQANLRVLENVLPEMLAGRRVLELACGTGYWTQFIAPRARRILAVDAATETLALAKAKELSPQRVEYRVADVYHLAEDLGAFDGAFAGFWWSHVPARDQPRFLASLDRRLDPGAKVVLLDNVYVEGSSTPLSRRDEEGNTYQTRRLADGSEHVVLKNFPSENDLRKSVERYGHHCQYLRLEFYWVFTYEKRGSA
jgi:demethylmenaquinone methyltransferase/2-methoxy-6-polyprenyl-1,4-benzoquinol methylase